MVVQWTTVQLMIIIEVMLGMKYNQGDNNSASIHAYIVEDEKVYGNTPKLFEHYSKNVLKNCLKLLKISMAFVKVHKIFEIIVKKSQNNILQKIDTKEPLFVPIIILVTNYYIPIN